MVDVKKLFSLLVLSSCLLWGAASFGQDKRIIQIQQAGSFGKDEANFPGANIILKKGDIRVKLFHRGRSSADRNAASVEEQVLKDWQDWCYALEHAGLKQERRNLTLRSDNVLYDWIEPNQLSLEFSLSRGCFATALLREIAQLSRPSYVAI